MEALAERLYRRWPTKYMGLLSWAAMFIAATGALLSDHRDLIDRGRHDIRGKAAPVHLFAVRC